MIQKSTGELSRRNFLGMGAVAAAGAVGMAALAGCSSQSAADDGEVLSATGDGRNWDYECDILFVGAGSSMMGAIDAHNAGAKVILIEKRDVLGGDTWLCGGVIRAGGNTKAQQEAGIIDERTGEPDTLEQFYEDWFVEEAGGQADPDVVRKCVEWSPGYIDWFMERGVSFKVFTAGVFPVSRSHQCGMEGELFAGIGKPYTDAMHAELDKLGIEYHINTRGLHVIQDEQLNVIGLQAMDMNTGEVKYYKAKAVVLATGGNAWNDELNMRYNPETINCLSNTGAQVTSATNPEPFGTGDGQVMAMECGARMCGFKPQDPGLSVPQPLGMFGEGEQTTSFHQYATSIEKSNIFVNMEGLRFCDETKGYENQIGRDIIAQTQNQCAVILDQALWDQPDYVLVGSNGSKEHMEELVDQGLVQKADTIEELAGALFIDADGLAQTVDTFNGYATNGEDPEFGRPAKTMRPLSQPPYYGFIMKAGGKGACINVKVNSQMEVMDLAQRKIPGLYAAGIWYNYGMVDPIVLGVGDYWKGGSGMGVNASITTAKIAAASALEYIQGMDA